MSFIDTSNGKVGFYSKNKFSNKNKATISYFNCKLKIATVARVLMSNLLLSLA